MTIADVAETSARFIAPTPVGAAAMPTVFPSGTMPAGTPIILAPPRLPRISSVASSLPSATMLTCQPPSSASAAGAARPAAASIFYPVDPYAQQVLEYSTGLQHTVAGCTQLATDCHFLSRMRHIFVILLILGRSCMPVTDSKGCRGGGPLLPTKFCQ